MNVLNFISILTFTGHYLGRTHPCAVCKMWVAAAGPIFNCNVNDILCQCWLRFSVWMIFHRRNKFSNLFCRFLNPNYYLNSLIPIVLIWIWFWFNLLLRLCRLQFAAKAVYSEEKNKRLFFEKKRQKWIKLSSQTFYNFC